MSQETKSPQVEEFQYEAEMNQLLKIIIHSLYSHKEIFLRELISNAADALSKARIEEMTHPNALEAKEEAAIKIHVDEENATLTIEDNGIGMTHGDLKEKLGTIAKSGTLDFINKMKERGNAEDLIGQFGVGFYSAFMVTDEIIVETRSLDKEEKAWTWRSKGAGSYTIEPGQREDRGTKIVIKLNDNGQEFKNKSAVENLIRKYSDFVPYPIKIEEDVINKQTALWQKSEKDVSEEDLNEFYKYIAHDFENPLGHKFMNIEGRVMFKSLVFIPGKAPFQLYQDREDTDLQLYVKRVFIQDDCKELLPAWLRFVKGVVDTESLPLNVSREVTQNSPVMTKIRDIITNNILKLLEEWAEKDPEKYKTFYREFGPILKEGLHYDFERKERIASLLRFESTTLEPGQTTSLADYISRMKSDQKEIYYLFGPDRETALKNPNLEYCQQEGLEVLLLTDPVDEFVMPALGTYKEKSLMSVTRAEFEQTDSAGGEKLGEADATELINHIKEVLGERVQDVRVSKRLVNSPVTLVPPADGMDPQMERMMKMMNKDFQGSKLIFEINTASPVIRNLSAKFKVQADNPLVKETIEHLFETARLVEGQLDKLGDYVQRTFTLLEKATAV